MELGSPSRALPVLLVLAALSGAGTAKAYCRTTTCDAANADADCQRDSLGCSTTGAELFWPDRCLSFSVQRDGSPLRGVDWRELSGLVKTGFKQWEAADCGGATPSITMFDLNETLGPVECAEPQFNRKEAPDGSTEVIGANANVWMFRDTGWPYTGASSTLALTTVTFGVRSGRILDADVEVNSYGVDDLTLSDQIVGTDLQSIITHEAGHFLGLAHSDSTQATMHATYRRGTVDFRTLDDDDEEGICAVYPPGRDVVECTLPTIVGGWASECDAPASTTMAATSPVVDEPGTVESCACRLGAPPRTSPIAAGLAALAAAGLLARRRRRA